MYQKAKEMSRTSDELEKTAHIKKLKSFFHFFHVFSILSKICGRKMSLPQWAVAVFWLRCCQVKKVAPNSLFIYVQKPAPNS
jgi:hypothetical protein